MTTNRDKTIDTFDLSLLPVLDSRVATPVFDQPMVSRVRSYFVVFCGVLFLSGGTQVLSKHNVTETCVCVCVLI